MKRYNNNACILIISVKKTIYKPEWYVSHWPGQGFLVVLDQKQKRNEEIPIFSSLNIQLAISDRFPAALADEAAVWPKCRHPHSMTPHWESHELVA